LDPADDLVSVYSDHIPPSSEAYSSSQTEVSSYPPSSITKLSEHRVSEAEGKPTLPAVAAALAVAILIPILTFSVIPNFIGRITVTALVACGVLGAVVQGGVVDQGRLLGSEGLMCVGIYGGVMVVVAGVMPG
jgi:hypothetical protein